MRKLIFVSAIAAMIELPLVAIAQPMLNLPDSVPAGTAVCRPALAGETANGSMGSSPMMCRSVDVVKVNAALKRLNAVRSQRQAAAAASTPDPSTKQMEQAASDVNAGFRPPVYPGSTQRN